MKNPNDYLPLALARDAAIMLNKIKIDTSIQTIFDSFFDHVFIKEGKELRSNEMERLKTELRLIYLWSLNKQVYRFDKDFIDAVFEMENVTVVRNMFHYLPYKNMYFDISANEAICKKIGCKGFFISVFDLPKKINLYFSLPAGLEETPSIVDYLTDSILCATDEQTISREEYIQSKINGGSTIEQAEMDYLKIQLLTYLCTVNPDIQKDSQTSITYKAPKNGKIRNVFAEVQIWETGVRYGSAFRKWQSEQQSGKMDSGRTSSKKRPHFRRAHWSHYWYGHGDDKVKRPKWISDIMVGTGDTGATIHSVG